MILYGTAILLGLAGNLHCLGMCGPIALAVPIKRNTFTSKTFSILLYNAGRILVYGFFGFLFGLFGKGLFIAGFQQSLSIFLGVLIIMAVTLPYFNSKLKSFNTPIILRIGKLKNIFQNQFKKSSYISIFTIGIFNGLLPCGLVFMALAGATATGSWQHGTIYMLLFGAGTLPVMFTLPYFGQFINQKVRLKFAQITPYVALMFGMLLILRGANLGIPYLSPFIEATKAGSTVICH
jgi:sulfite exporter TauE/SafE